MSESLEWRMPMGYVHVVWNNIKILPTEIWYEIKDKIEPSLGKIFWRRAFEILGYWIVGNFVTGFDHLFY
jgi:hypothetical protein